MTLKLHSRPRLRFGLSMVFSALLHLLPLLALVVVSVRVPFRARVALGEPGEKIPNTAGAPNGTGEATLAPGVPGIPMPVALIQGLNRLGASAAHAAKRAAAPISPRLPASAPQNLPEVKLPQMRRSAPSASVAIETPSSQKPDAVPSDGVAIVALRPFPVAPRQVVPQPPPQSEEAPVKAVRVRRVAMPEGLTAPGPAFKEVVAGKVDSVEAAIEKSPQVPNSHAILEKSAAPPSVAGTGRPDRTAFRTEARGELPDSVASGGNFAAPPPGGPASQPEASARDPIASGSQPQASVGEVRGAAAGTSSAKTLMEAGRPPTVGQEGTSLSTSPEASGSLNAPSPPDSNVKTADATSPEGKESLVEGKQTSPVPQNQSSEQAKREADGQRDPWANAIQVAVVAPADPPASAASAQEAIARAQQALMRAERGEQQPAAAMREAEAALAEAEHAVKRNVGQTAPSIDGPPGSGMGKIPGPGSIAKGDAFDALVQERVSHVAEIVGAGAARRVGRGGTAHIRFWVDRHGYVAGEALLSSSGSNRLDEEIPVILHLAEPYPGGERSYTVDVVFRAALYAPAFGGEAAGP
jgi:TonB family protein